MFWLLWALVFRIGFLNMFLCVSLNCPHVFLLVSFSCWLSSLYPCMVWTSSVYVFRMHTMCLHTWPLKKILLNVSMEASTFSLSGMLAYSKDYTLEVKEYRTLSKLLKLYMWRGACSSGHLCRGVVLDLSMGVACSSGHARCACGILCRGEY